MADEKCAKCNKLMILVSKWHRCGRCNAWFCPSCMNRFCFFCKGGVDLVAAARR